MIQILQSKPMIAEYTYKKTILNISSNQTMLKEVVDSISKQANKTCPKKKTLLSLHIYNILLVDGTISSRKLPQK